MPAILHALFLMLAHSSRSELIQQVQYLKVENQVLRGKLPERVQLTPAERSRLLKLGRLVGPAIKDLISIVHPRTFRPGGCGNRTARLRRPRLAAAGHARQRVSAS